MKPNMFLGTLEKPVQGYVRRFVSAGMDLTNTANERLANMYGKKAQQSLAIMDVDTMPARVQSYAAARQPIEKMNETAFELPETATMHFFG